MGLYTISGLKPEIFNNTKIIFDGGTISVWHSNNNWDYSDVDVPTAGMSCDLSTIGIGGRDGGPMSDGIWYLWFLVNPTTGAYGVMGSHIGNSSVVFPQGYVYFRKMCIGLTMIGGALQPIHVANWPMPTVRFTQPPVLTLFGAARWQALNLSSLVPDTSRSVLFRTVLSGDPGNAKLAPSSSGGFFKLVNFGGQSAAGDVGVRVDSSMNVYAQVSGSSQTRLDVYVDGFEMTAFE